MKGKTLIRLQRQFIVKSCLKGARADMTLRQAAKALRVDPAQVMRWEDPDGAVPSGKTLQRVFRWIERRIGQKFHI